MTLPVEANRRKERYMYKVIVDIAPKTIPGTNGCHKYVFGEYKTKREALKVIAEINASNLYKKIVTIEKRK